MNKTELLGSQSSFLMTLHVREKMRIYRFLFLSSPADEMLVGYHVVTFFLAYICEWKRKNTSGWNLKTKQINGNMINQVYS